MSEMEVLKQTCHDKAALSADGKADYLPEIFEQGELYNYNFASS